MCGVCGVCFTCADLQSTELTLLELESCIQLDELPQLPASIESIRISGAPTLQRLPSLPEGLKKLELKDCSSLQVGTWHTAFACTCDGNTGILTGSLQLSASAAGNFQRGMTLHGKAAACKVSCMTIQQAMPQGACCKTMPSHVLCLLSSMRLASLVVAVQPCIAR